MSSIRADDTARHLNRTISVGFLIALVFAALAHGAVEPWSLFIFEAIITVLLLLWFVKAVADKRLRLNVPNTALPIAALIVVGLAQSIAFTGAARRVSSLSKNVGYTRAAVMVLVFLFVCYLLSANFFNTWDRLSALSRFLVLYGLAMALFALVQHFAWNGRFYWLRPTEATSPFGPFANHNHFAGYMELLIPIPIALIITRAVRAELRLLYGFAAVMMILAAVLSLSRGGMISIAASMMFLVLMGMRLPRLRGAPGKRRLTQAASQTAVVIAIVGIVFGGILWIGADPIINRVNQSQLSSGESVRATFASSRGWIWRDTMSMISANPVLGVGMGAYETAFSIYTKSDGSLRVPQAHNDYLQVVADCGIVGGVIGLWFIASLLRRVAAGTRSRDPLYSGLALGTGAGIFAMLVHSLFDFNLQLPSNAVLFLLLSAVATQVGAVVENQEGSPLPAQRGVPIQPEVETASYASLARGSS